MAAWLGLQGGWPLLVARAIADAGLLCTCGGLAFRVWVAPHALARAPDEERMRLARALARLVAASLALAAFGLAVWTLLQSGAIAGATSLAGAVVALPPVLRDTQFGHLVLLQFVLLAGIAAAASRQRVALALLASGCVAVAQAAHGHLAAMDGVASSLFAVDALHVLAAAAWIGGLPSLLLVVRLGSAATGAAACRRFSAPGKACVVVLAGTALVQGWVLVGSIDALRTTPYGWVVLLKAALFGVLSGFAVLNRYRLAPALRSVSPEPGRRRLAASIALQTGFGLLAVLAAALLSGLEPGMDMGR